MRRFMILAILMFAIAVVGACDQAGEYTEKKTGPDKEPAADVTAELTEIESKVWENWKKHDSSYVDGLARDDFKDVSAEGVGDKKAMKELFEDKNCELTSYKLSDASTRELAEGVVLFLSKAESDFKCGDQKGPSPTYGATLYVKNGDKWEAAYHQTTIAEEAKKEGTPSSPPAEFDPKNAEDELTAKLVEKETSLWEAWKNKDSDAFDKTFTEDSVSMGANGLTKREEILKSIKESDCEVGSYAIEGAKASEITKDVVLLNYRTKIDATCGGEKLPSGSWVSSIWVRDGEEWKSSFYMGSN